jgi:hypothetical protein
MEATADGSRVAYSASGPNDIATTIYDGRTGERLAGPVVGLVVTRHRPGRHPLWR